MVLVETRLRQALEETETFQALGTFASEFNCVEPPGHARAETWFSMSTQKCDYAAAGRWKRTTKKGSEWTVLERFLIQA